MTRPIGCLLTVLLISGWAHAANPIPPEEEAQWHEDNAIAATEKGDVETALREYEIAFSKFPDGIYLYDIAFLLDARGKTTGCKDHRPAADYYRRFLGEVAARPATYVERADVAEKIPDSRKRALALEAECGPVLPPPPPPPSPYRPAGIGATIAGAAAAVVGAILLWHGVTSRETTSISQPTEDKFWDTVDAGRTEQMAGSVLVAVGAAGVVAGATLLLLPKRRDRLSTWLVTPTTQGVLVTGTF